MFRQVKLPRKMNLLFWVAIIATPALAELQPTACERSGLWREVKVTYDNAVTQEGCRVLYRKKDEGLPQSKVIWHSQFEPLFCETKAHELLKRLKDWGWTCQPKTALKKTKYRIN